MHQMQSSRYPIGFSYEQSAGRWSRQCFLSDKSCIYRIMYTIVSAVLRQQRKSDVMTSFGHSARSTVYYQAGSPLPWRRIISHVAIMYILTTAGVPSQTL
jgi:hypothetical protein